MDWVGMERNLKKIRLTVFKFSRFRFQNAVEEVISRPFEEFSWFIFLDVPELFCN